ncbi:MAG: arylsulfatase [Verrucomicrobiales bacterium]|nr:arylsulfatase [Verrucomicrobiales bacterium]
MFVFRFATALVFLFTSLLAAQEKPNVILILADDLAIGDLSLFNDDLCETPHIDALIEDSVYFNRAYSGSPVCAPSRAALLTGRSPHRTGVVSLNQIKYPGLTRLYKDEVTLANLFQENGYATGLVGKWHSGNGEGYHPLDRGFEHFEGFNASVDIKTYFEYKLDLQGDYQDFSGEYLTDSLTRRAIAYVNEHKSEPFFLHLAHYAPHRPLSAPDEMIAKYTAKGVEEKIAKVYAMVDILDKGIGELMTELDRLKLREKTIVIFSSDNGPDPIPGERFNLDMRGMKYEVYEGGIHVPFLVNWKGTLSPAKHDEIIQFIDVFPTLMEICSINPVPETRPLDGASFAGLLSEKYAPVSLPEQRFWQWNRTVPMYSHNAAIREGDWKLVRPFVTRNVPQGESQEAPILYHLGQDPAEDRDVGEFNPNIRDRLNARLEEWTNEIESDRRRNPDTPTAISE